MSQSTQESFALLLLYQCNAGIYRTADCSRTRDAIEHIVIIFLSQAMVQQDGNAVDICDSL